MPLEIEFDDNRLVPVLFGEYDANLARIEHQLGVHVASRGNRVTINGPRSAVAQAETVLLTLWDRLRAGQPIDEGELDATIRLAAHDAQATGPSDSLLPGIARNETVIHTRKRRIVPRTANQAAYVETLARHTVCFGLGPAGTGKTFLAVAQAVSMLTMNKVERIVLTRPAVEAGERLGFLPGDLRDKIDPYLQPLYDALRDMLPDDQVRRLMDIGTIEVAPLAFMRGRTLAHAFIILDEAQNTTPMQMKMFLTRMGENSRVAVTGDTSQIDLPSGVRSGLIDALDVLAGIDGVGITRFDRRDVVRHPMVANIVAAYEQRDRARSREPAGG